MDFGVIFVHFYPNSQCTQEYSDDKIQLWPQPSVPLKSTSHIFLFLLKTFTKTFEHF